MSKRVRTRPVTDNTLEIPTEIWFIIGKEIPWYEVGSLLAFLAVSQSAIRFVQTSIRTLVTNVLSTDYAHPLLWSLTREFRSEPKVEKTLRKCLVKYHANTTGTPREWREQSAVILSIIRLSQLRSEYLSIQDRQSYNRITNEIPSNSKLGNVYFCPNDGKTPLSIDRLRITHVVEGLPDYATMFPTAEASIRKNFVDGQREVYLHALNGTFGDELRAVVYYAMAKTLNVRAATSTDSFRDVVLVNPHADDDFLHIYSRYSYVVKTFRKSCLTYKGEPRDAPRSFHLHFNQSRHNKSCIEQCKRILRFL